MSARHPTRSRPLLARNVKHKRLGGSRGRRRFGLGSGLRVGLELWRRISVVGVGVVPVVGCSIGCSVGCSIGIAFVAIGTATIAGRCKEPGEWDHA